MSEVRRRSIDSEGRELGRERDRRLHRVAASRYGMVSTQHHRATEIGVQILADGGNAVDAAVATAFALGVCEPNASGLGGQTMMMLRIRGRRGVIALDGSSSPRRFPRAGTDRSNTDLGRARGEVVGGPDRWVDTQCRPGGLAVTNPKSVGAGPGTPPSST